MQTKKQLTFNFEKKKYNREFTDNNLNMFKRWSIEKFNRSSLKMVYIIFITFPTVSVFGCLKMEQRKKNFHFVSLSFFVFPHYQ